MTKDTAAFQKALDTCAVSGGGEVIVPAGRYLIGSVQIGYRTHAIYIKTRIGRAGVTENIHGEDLDVLAGGFLRINLTQGGNTNTADDPVEGLLGYPSARNLSFSNVRLHHATVLVEGTQIAPEKPVEGLSLVNVTGTAAKGITLHHARDVVLKGIHVTGFTGPLVTAEDVTGQGLN